MAALGHQGEARPRDLVGLRPKAACFDFFEEYSARLPKFTSEDFRVQRTFLGRGIVIIEQATRLGELLGKRFDFFAPFPSQVMSVEGRSVTVDRSMAIDVTLTDANP